MSVNSSIPVLTHITYQQVLHVLIDVLDTGAISYWVRCGEGRHSMVKDEATGRRRRKPRPYDLEGHNYEVVWAALCDPDELEWLEDKPWTSRLDYFAPLTGGALVFYVDPDDNDGKDHAVLDMASITVGLHRLWELYPRVYGELVEGGDAITADRFMQLALFGRMVY